MSASSFVPGGKKGNQRNTAQKTQHGSQTTRVRSSLVFFLLFFLLSYLLPRQQLEVAGARLVYLTVRSKHTSRNGPEQSRKSRKTIEATSSSSTPRSRVPRSLQTDLLSSSVLFTTSINVEGLSAIVLAAIRPSHRQRSRSPAAHPRHEQQCSSAVAVSRRRSDW